MRTFQLRLLSAIIALIAGFVNPAAQAELQTGLTLIHDGEQRIYDLYVPDTAHDGPLPLVFDLHGFGGTRVLHRLNAGLDIIAEQEGFLVVYPDGLNNRWNAEIGADGADDVGFIRALVEKVSVDHVVAAEQVYATGFSQGGMMAYRLACQAADVFAAVAPVAGGIIVGTENLCQPSRAVPVLSFRGDTDQIVPFDGGVVAGVMPQVSVLSADDSLVFWRTLNACSGSEQVEVLGPMSSCRTHTTCEDNSIISFCTVSGIAAPGNHRLYQNSDNINLGQRIWDFFANVTLQAPLFQINAGLNDAWFNPATAGQGLFITVFPELGKIFLAMFTYDTMRPDGSVIAQLGEPGHRWLTAFGDFADNIAVLDVELTEGGIFDAAQPMPSQTPAYGTLTLEFHDCNSLSLTYSIPSLNLQGSIPLQRIALDNVAACQTLSRRQTGHEADRSMDIFQADPLTVR